MPNSSQPHRDEWEAKRRRLAGLPPRNLHASETPNLASKMSAFAPQQPAKAKEGHSIIQSHRSFVPSYVRTRSPRGIAKDHLTRFGIDVVKQGNEEEDEGQTDTVVGEQGRILV